MKNDSQTNIAKVSPSQFIEVMRTILLSKVALFLWGPSGIGKSALVKQVAEELELEFRDLRTSLLDAVDLRGLPSVVNGLTKWMQPDFLPTCGKGVLFLDELPTALPMVQAALYQLVLDRKIGDYTLPDGWVVMAAGNPASERGVFHTVPRPLRNRFIHLELEANLGEWCKWAKGAGVRADIIAYLKFHDGKLFDPGVDFSVNAWPTPRSWEMASRAMDAIDSRKTAITPEIRKMLLNTAVTGAVGEATAGEFMGFLSLFKNLPSIDEILLNPTGAPVPEEPSAQFVIAMTIGRRMKDSTINQFSKYLARMSDELQMMAMRDAVVRDRTIATTKEFTDFTIDHDDLLAA